MLVRLSAVLGSQSRALETHLETPEVAGTEQHEQTVTAPVYLGEGLASALVRWVECERRERKGVESDLRNVRYSFLASSLARFVGFCVPSLPFHAPSFTLTFFSATT